MNRWAITLGYITVIVTGALVVSSWTLYFSNRLTHRLDMQINSCVSIEGKLDMLLEATIPQPEQQPQQEERKDGRNG